MAKIFTEYANLLHLSNFFFIVLFLVIPQSVQTILPPNTNVTLHHSNHKLLSTPHHDISRQAKENVEICKSRPFAPTQLNYIRSGADDWLKEYTLENKDREYFKKHGLVSTIAYDFLGDTNFKCAIGIQHSCAVQCLNVVGHIEDLTLARRVYFVLSSAGHFVSAVDMIHNSLQAAQGNVGLMAGKMSMTFFWIQPSSDELARQARFDQMLQITLWAAQSALNSLLPIIPWTGMTDWVVTELSKKMDRPMAISSEQSAIDPLNFSENEVSEIQTYKWAMNRGYMDDQHWGMRVPARFGGNLWWNPDGNSLLDWWHTNGHVDGRLWKQEFYGEWKNNEKQMYNLTQPGENDVIYRYGWFLDFRGRMMIHGFKEAVTHAWGDFKDLCGGSWYNWKKAFHGLKPSKEAKEIQAKYFDGYGTIDGFTVTKESLRQAQEEGRQVPQGRYKPGKISYITYLRTKNQVDPPTKLKDGDKIVSWGPQTERDVLGRYESWDSYDQYHTEQLAKTWPIPDKPQRDWNKHLTNVTHHIEMATQRAQVVTSILFPMLTQWVIKTAVMSMFSTWTGSDNPREKNEMGLQFFIQGSSRISRIVLKETVNRVLQSGVVAEDGSTELANILAVGSYLPVTEGVLGAWTAPDVENTLTKNIFYKTLNTALNSQKIYVSCTTDLQNRKDGFRNPFKIPGPKKHNQPVDECTNDNTGPQNRKACIGEAVCYLYRWNDRGIIMTHTVEDPFGFEALDAEPWKLNTSDIITSSFYSHLFDLQDVQLASNLSVLNSGPTVEQAADPSVPGMFTLPVCLTTYNWNSQTDKKGLIDDLDPFSTRKALPCHCGPLGADTSKVWHAMGITGTAATQQYAKVFCPNQIGTKIKDWLERYVAYCRLGIRRGSVLKNIKMGRDGLCDLVISELEGKGVVSTLQLEPEHRDAFKCKIKGDKKDSKCKPYLEGPISKVWDETSDAIIARKLKEEEAVKEEEMGKAKGKQPKNKEIKEEQDDNEWDENEDDMEENTDDEVHDWEEFQK